MNKQEHINYWLVSARKNLKTVNNLFAAKDYVPSLFFVHLHLEKLCKALWVKNNKGNHPPRIHNLVSILKESKIDFSEDQLDLMIIMNNFQLEGRYPDYQHKLYKTYKNARNKQSRYSDIDVALVSNKFTGVPSEDVKLFINALRENYIIQVMTYNTKDFSPDKDPFVGEILNSGIEIKLNSASEGV